MLARDVEALFLDAGYRATSVETAARLLPWPVEWHPGYRLTVAGLLRHADYRGREYVELGARIAQDGRLDPRITGDAARTGRHALQDLKMVWHTLARFGAPEGAGTAWSEDASDAEGSAAGVGPGVPYAVPGAHAGRRAVARQGGGGRAVRRGRVRGRPTGGTRRGRVQVVDSVGSTDSADASDTWQRARSVLEGARVDPDRLARVRPLSGGTYNAVEELLLTDGSRYVLKVAPAPTVPALRYESRLLVSEAEFYRGAAEAGVPAPRVVEVGEDAAVGHMLMTACPGEPWDDSLTEAQQSDLRAELGRQVARLHRVTGPAFGYPSGALGPLAPDWRTAFTAMIEAILADAHRYRARLPRPADEVARTLRAAFPALDEVTAPRLVHFDLWRGNILVDRPAAGEQPRIGGLIDGERMFWGDPLADFVSLALLGDIEKDEAFLGGYREAGGRAEFDAPARIRLALYRAYLYLIMLTETVPRAVDAGQERWVRETVAPELVAALDEIEDSVS